MAEYERLILQEDEVEALNALEQALALDPDDPTLWLEKCVTLRRLGRYTESLAG
jgi:Flp pilus assembly protein TadD